MKTKTRQISHAAILRQLSNPREMARLNALCCEDSFFEFVRQFWHVNSAATPVWNWHIKYLCREIQIVAERVFRDEPKEYDLIINVPPGSTKSTIASIMLPAWAWARMPSCQVICASYVASLSLKLSRQCRNIIRSPLYQRYWPHLAISRDNDTKTEFSNTMGGFRYACGIGGSVTGNHAHIQIVDDPLDPKGAASIPFLDTANAFMNETLYNRKIRLDLTPLILIMQRLHQNDPTGMILSQGQKDIKHICLPAEITDGQQVFPPELLPHYKDGLLDPVRLSMKELEKAKKKLGPYGYAGQYDQTPIPRSGGTFQTDRIGVEHGTPVIAYKVRAWDKAASPSRGDYTTGVLMGVDNEDRYWVLDVVRGQWDTAERERVMRQTAHIDGYDTRIGLEIEPGSSGIDSFVASVNNLAGFAVEKIAPVGSKENRAEAFSIQVNYGNVRCVQADWNRAYLDELAFFPAGSHDDQVDASAMAFRMLLSQTAGETQYGVFF